jgi:hypothetical protein
VARTDPEALRAVVALAFIQLTIEEIKTSDRDWNAVIHRPPDAASIDQLRDLLELCAARGIKREDNEDDPMNQSALHEFTQGAYLRRPPRPGTRPKPQIPGEGYRIRKSDPPEE